MFSRQFNATRGERSKRSRVPAIAREARLVVVMLRRTVAGKQSELEIVNWFLIENPAFGRHVQAHH
jgi:hypothetical protein